MHSSRMHTACALTISPSMLFAWGCMVLGGCMVPGGLVIGGEAGVVSQHALRQTPPVNRMTDACENITLPQTSFAGGNYYSNGTGSLKNQTNQKQFEFSGN